MSSLIKYFRFFLAIVQGHITKKRVPILVTLCVTNHCNIRCKYCYGEFYDSKEKDFRKEEIFALIDELAAMGTRYISINGGEALLRNDIEEIIDKIREKNLLCHISTNGTLVRRRLSAIRKIDSVAISIDGKRESNDLNRGAGTFDQIIEAIKLLKSEGIHFHTHTVITKHNKDTWEEVIDLAGEYGFKAQFSLCRVQDSPDKSLGFRDDELKVVIGKILDYKRRGYPVFFSQKTYENYLNWPKSYDEHRIVGELPFGFNHVECHIKQFSCHIEPTGLVYPCIVLVDKYKALNFKDVGITKAWDHLASNKCTACYNICCTDQNLVFGFRPESLGNAVGVVRERLAFRNQKKDTLVTSVAGDCHSVKEVKALDCS